MHGNVCLFTSFGLACIKPLRASCCRGCIVAEALQLSHSLRLLWWLWAGQGAVRALRARAQQAAAGAAASQAELLSLKWRLEDALQVIEVHTLAGAFMRHAHNKRRCCTTASTPVVATHRPWGLQTG